MQLEDALLEVGVQSKNYGLKPEDSNLEYLEMELAVKNSFRSPVSPHA